jgi:predicted ferric reductase
MRAARLLPWAAVLALGLVPATIAATSPLLAWRSVPYIIGGMAGVLALAVLLVQPLLAAGYQPGPGIARARIWHRRLGMALVVLVVLHIGGLYLASPPDTLDALLLVSPTPFSVYGVTALWTLMATALLVALRGRLGWRPAVWRVVHNALAAVVVVATVVHALMIEGAMGHTSKLLLCLAVLAVAGGTILHLRLVRPLARRR